MSPMSRSLPFPTRCGGVWWQKHPWYLFMRHGWLFSHSYNHRSCKSASITAYNTPLVIPNSTCWDSAAWNLRVTRVNPLPTAPAGELRRTVLPNKRWAKTPNAPPDRFQQRYLSASVQWTSKNASDYPIHRTNFVLKTSWSTTAPFWT